MSKFYVVIDVVNEKGEMCIDGGALGEHLVFSTIEEASKCRRQIWDHATYYADDKELGL